MESDSESGGVTVFSFRHHDGWGTTMMEVSGRWSEELTDEWLARGPSCGLIYAARGGDLGFLPELTGLRFLAVSGRLDDDSAIGDSVALERVVLISTTTNAIDWSRLRSLRRLSVHARPGLQTLSSLDSLVELVLWECRERDFSLLGTISAVRELRLKPCRRLTSLTGIAGLTRLRLLEINHAASRLDLTELSALPELAVLHFAGCRRQATLEGIQGCRSLTELSLENCGRIDSLLPVGATQLSKLYVGGGTNIVDGQLSFLRGMPSLRFADFEDRKHYDIRSRDLPKFLG